MIFNKKLIPKNIKEYNELYNYSITNPESFWSEVADSFIWKKKWSKVLKYDFNKPNFEWFSNGKLNITENCLDRHVKNNPEKKRETCLSFIEKTRSEFCTIAKKKIYSTNQALKEKISSTVRKDFKTTDSNSSTNFYQSKKSARELAISFQNKLIKKTKDRYKSIKFYLVSR